MIWVFVIGLSLGLLAGATIGYYTAATDADRRHRATTRKINTL